jgi:glycerol-3-phosphate dehydrogenase subunit B
MDLSTDIVVIGGGLAGLSAALEARARGLRVLVIQKGPGATSLSSGALDLADSPLRVPGEAWGGHLSIESNLNEILRRFSHHPYALLNRRIGDGALADLLRTKVRRLLEALPLGFQGDLESNRLQITPFGTIKATAVVQGSMADADVLSMNQAKILVVGIRGFPSFNARFLKEALLEAQGAQPVPWIQFVGHTDVEINGLEGRSSLTPFEVASRLDREECFVRFGQSILSYIQGKVYTHLLLPPVMGIVNHEPIILALRKITGLRAAETLATVPSIPGYRLDQAIHHVFQEREVERIDGTVVGYDAGSAGLKSLRLHAGNHRARVEAKAFVLASGKFIGGGVGRHQRFREPIFNLPLYEEGKDPIENRPMTRMTRPEISAPQPVFRTGIRTNDFLQPLDSKGDAAFPNLFAAGSILRGYDFIRDRTGSGVAILTGASAGENAGAVTP